MAAAVVKSTDVAMKNLKRAEAASAPRYSGCPPGALGEIQSSSCSAIHAVSTVAAHHSEPTRAAAAFGAVTTVGAKPPKASVYRVLTGGVLVSGLVLATVEPETGGYL